MEQFDSSVEESSKVSEQQQRNDEQQCPSCAAELTEYNNVTYYTTDKKSTYDVLMLRCEQDVRLLTSKRRMLIFYQLCNK